MTAELFILSCLAIGIVLLILVNPTFHRMSKSERRSFESAMRDMELKNKAKKNGRII